MLSPREDLFFWQRFIPCQRPSGVMAAMFCFTRHPEHLGSILIYTLYDIICIILYYDHTCMNILQSSIIMYTYIYIHILYVLHNHYLGRTFFVRLPSGDADIQDFYGKLLTGPGGEPAKGTVLSELIVKFFHGDGETVGGGGLRPLRDSGAI